MPTDCKSKIKPGGFLIMSNCAIVGINWGDEGKGRMVDLLTSDYDVVVRYQGGGNAGHTVVNNKGKFALHLLPSGIFRDGVVNVLGNGVALDCENLWTEMTDVISKGVSITPDNLKIRDDFTVCFMDVDSFHFRSSGKTFKCEVCAPGYVAPELIKACKGTTYADCSGPTFTEETDNFSLAIHCFRMLMNGCHPFICQRQLKRAGSAPAPKSTDKRIESGETPFFKSIPNYTTPSYAPDINSLPPYIHSLFKRAFVDGHSNPKARPTPAEWKAALVQFKNELTRCKHNSAHYYWSANASCPYCEAEKNYAKKMSNSMASANAFSASARTAPPSPPVQTTFYAPPTAASPAATVIKPGVSTSAALFWSITIVASVILLAILGSCVLPQLY